MTDPAQTALDFCRDVLGWDRSVDRRFAERNRNATGDGGSKAWTPYVFDFYGEHGQFYNCDLDAVMEAVGEWRDRTQDALGGYVTVNPRATALHFP